MPGKLLPLARERVKSFRTFAAGAIADYKTTGAVAPSSRYLAEAMLAPLALKPGCVVVELGAGTGVMTRALLDALPNDATLLVFEISDRFYKFLRANFRDKRLVLLQTRAEHLDTELQRRSIERVDGVVSSLALGFFTDTDRKAVLEAFLPFMGEGSVYTQYQYMQGIELRDGRLRRFSVHSLLRHYFRSVRRQSVWRNIPPAYVYACKK